MDRPKRRLAGAAAALLVMWFIPEVLASPPLFAFNLVSRLEGVALAGLLAIPVAGCLVLALIALLSASRKLFATTFCIGLTAMVLAVVGYMALPVSRVVVVIALLVSLAAGLLVFKSDSKRHSRIGMVLLGWVPAALFLTALYGAVLGEVSAAYLSSLKQPLSLMALVMIAGVSGREWSNGYARTPNPRRR